MNKVWVLLYQTNYDVADLVAIYSEKWKADERKAGFHNYDQQNLIIEEWVIDE